ncbi:beta-galactosidase-like isoform X2 [Ornithodoros turicata]|uniref:beta-galactosidase-like isoform X2 n=1 Tax=Ornithodoros turicata TaxID=34597 RepID=UPI0031394E09
MEHSRTHQRTFQLRRLGPFIDAERDMGGLPFWLMTNNSNVALRTSSPAYLRYVDRYYSKLLPLLKPLLYCNGGPVIMLQIENEYGSYPACDFKYTSHLRDLVLSYVGKDVILYSTDGNDDDFLKCGKNDGVYTTIDFGTGTNVSEAFAVQRRHQWKGPFANSEFYPGWLDLWGIPHSTVPAADVVKTLKDMLLRNASFNIYPFHGGTSFAFTAGAVISDGNYRPCVTSYDFDAPMTEAGDPTPKYFDIRNTISQFIPLPPVPPPHSKPKMSVGPITLHFAGGLQAIIRATWKAAVQSTYPLSFEDVNHGYGLMVYMTNITFRTANPAVLRVSGLRDRGYVYVDGVFKGILSRMDNVFEILLPIKQGSTLAILVENQGRVSVGPGTLDRKGIISNVTLGTRTLTHWMMLPVSTNVHEALVGRAIGTTPRVNQSSAGLAVYFAVFSLLVSEPQDTFLRLDGWTKGFAYLNGQPLGRYWPGQGPQVTLYVPSLYFQQHNRVVVIEQEEAPCGSPESCTISFVSEPEINGPVPEGGMQLKYLKYRHVSATVEA